jgi:hypothetical protein
VRFSLGNVEPVFIRNEPSKLPASVISVVLKLNLVSLHLTPQLKLWNEVVQDWQQAQAKEPLPNMHQFVLANTLITTQALKDADDWPMRHAAKGLGQGGDVED